MRGNIWAGRFASGCNLYSNGFKKMNVEDFKEIIYEKEDSGLVMLTLNNPSKKNALSIFSFLELYWAIDAMENDETAGVMVITGAKDPDSNDPTAEAFSSGGYFDMSTFENMPDEVKAIMDQIDLTDLAQKKLTMKLVECDKPIIAAINGLAIGGGYNIPLAGADLIYMSEHAWIMLHFAKIGLSPEFASTYFLPRRVGFQRAKEIFYFGDRISARDAFDMGLVNKVLPHDELIPFARQKALELIPPKGAALSVRRIKRAINKPIIEAVSRALDLENEYLTKSFATQDFQEAMKARKKKREPNFKGK